MLSHKNSEIPSSHDTLQQLYRRSAFLTQSTSSESTILDLLHVASGLVRHLNKKLCKLATWIKLVKPSAFSSVIKCAFIFLTSNDFGCFRGHLAQFELTAEVYTFDYLTHSSVGLSNHTRSERMHNNQPWYYYQCLNCFCYAIFAPEISTENITKHIRVSISILYVRQRTDTSNEIGI